MRPKFSIYKINIDRKRKRLLILANLVSLNNLLREILERMLELILG